LADTCRRAEPPDAGDRQQQRIFDAVSGSPAAARGKSASGTLFLRVRGGISSPRSSASTAVPVDRPLDCGIVGVVTTAGSNALH
jgi:hypothetical protein